MHTVILIGPPGSGKTTCGQLLAKKLGWTFIDSDGLVTESAGLTVKEIFEKIGERKFRDLESQALDRLSAEGGETKPRVLSTGGGLPVFDNNMERLLTLGCVIYLQTRLEVLESRLQGGYDRPLLTQGHNPGKPDNSAAAAGKSDACKRLQQLLAERAPVYERARYKIDTSDLSAPEVVNKIAHLLSLEAKEQTAG
jgi:shikimate kinase